jgi:hypothetical protein
MGEKVASLYAEISANTTGLKQGLAETQAGLITTGDKMQRLGTMASNLGMKMTIGMTVPIVAGMVKMVDSASDLYETMNKVDVVFGDAADEVKAFGQDAAQSLGMSRQGALEAAGTFGNLFTSMGLGQDTAAGMSTSLLTLASDLASFNNIDPTVALEKLRAGLVGEVEPLRTLGVNLSAAAVELKAVEMGLVSSGEELDAAAKAQAAYALIMEQTTNAQGDFARTSDGLANSTRIVKAQIADAAAEMGNNLLPIALELTTKVSGLVEKFSDMDPATQKTILGVAGVTAAMGPLLTVTGKLITILPTLNTAFVALAANPVAIAFAGIAIAVGGLIAVTAEMEKGTQAAAAEIGGMREALDKGVISWEEYRHVIIAVENDTITAAEAQEWLNEKIEEYNDSLPEATYATRDLTDANKAFSEQMSMTAEDIRLWQAGLAGVVDTSEQLPGIFGELYTRYNDVESAQGSLIEQGIRMIEGLGAQARATALLAYWNGELSLAEYQAAVSQSYQLDTLQQLNDAFAEGSITQLTWMAIMSDGVATAEELARALSNGTSEVESIGDAMIATANGPAQAWEAELREINGLVQSASGNFDINFNVSVTGDPIPNGGGGGSWTNTNDGPDELFDAAANDFVVPAGYADDSYRVNFSSGEEVHVSKPGEQPSGGGDVYHITINASGGASGYDLYRQFKDALDSDLRESGRGGISTSDY